MPQPDRRRGSLHSNPTAIRQSLSRRSLQRAAVASESPPGRFVTKSFASVPVRRRVSPLLWRASFKHQKKRTEERTRATELTQETNRPQAQAASARLRAFAPAAPEGA